MTLEMNTVTDIIERMKQQEFEHEFEVEHNMLISQARDEKFKPEDMVIVEVQRAEGESDLDDTAIVYGLTAQSGTKGYLVDALENQDKSEFIKKIRVKDKKTG